MDDGRSLRFRTNPDDPGTEKLSIWPPTDDWLENKYVKLPHLDGAGEGVGPREYQVCCLMLGMILLLGLASL